MNSTKCIQNFPGFEKWESSSQKAFVAINNLNVTYKNTRKEAKHIIDEGKNPGKC